LLVRLFLLLLFSDGRCTTLIDQGKYCNKFEYWLIYAKTVLPEGNLEMLCKDHNFEQKLERHKILNAITANICTASKSLRFQIALCTMNNKFSA
jgi:hypothetical protein